MTESYVWVVTRLLPFGVPTVSRYRLVRRLPAGGAVVLEHGRRRQIRPSADVFIRDTAELAAECVRYHAANARRRAEDVLNSLPLAGRVHDVPSEGYTGPIVT